MDGGWSVWIFWFFCDKFCGGGVRECICFCINLFFYYGGWGCGIYYYEFKECVINKCLGEE